MQCCNQMQGVRCSDWQVKTDSAPIGLLLCSVAMIDEMCSKAAGRYCLALMISCLDELVVNRRGVMFKSPSMHMRLHVCEMQVLNETGLHACMTKAVQHVYDQHVATKLCHFCNIRCEICSLFTAAHHGSSTTATPSFIK